MDCADLPDDCNFSKIGYCSHPTFPYAYIWLKQPTEFILSNFQEEDHPFIHETLKNKKTQLVSLYIFYRLKKKSSRTDIKNDDQNAYSFVPTYGDVSTTFTIIWYQLFCFYTQTHFKVCWWITKLNKLVSLMILWILHHVPKQWGEMLLLHFFCTFPNISILIKLNFYINTYFQGIDEFNIFKVRFQGY